MSAPLIVMHLCSVALVGGLALYAALFVAYGAPLIAVVCGASTAVIARGLWLALGELRRLDGK